MHTCFSCGGLRSVFFCAFRRELGELCFGSSLIFRKPSAVARMCGGGLERIVTTLVFVASSFPTIAWPVTLDFVTFFSFLPLPIFSCRSFAGVILAANQKCRFVADSKHMWQTNSLFELLYVLHFSLLHANSKFKFFAAWPANTVSGVLLDSEIFAWQRNTY